jgi:hypothetical protein
MPLPREELYLGPPAFSHKLRVKKSLGDATQREDGKTGLFRYFHRITHEEYHEQTLAELERTNERIQELQKAAQLKEMRWQQRRWELATIRQQRRRARLAAEKQVCIDD